MDLPYQCGICNENFRLEEFAIRCEAQGIPPFEYQPNDIVASRDGKILSVISLTLTHHGSSICPVDGPCEHKNYYIGYDLHPGIFESHHAWTSELESSPPHPIESDLEVVAHANGNRIFISQNHEPETYLSGPDINDEWDKLWELYTAAIDVKKSENLLSKPRKFFSGILSH